MKRSRGKLSSADESGFTMIEMLITAVIIGFVAALAVPNFQSAYDRHSFRSGHQELVSMLKEARSYAISTKEPYGVHFDQNSMIVTLFHNRSNPASTAFDDADSALAVDTLPYEFQYLYTDAENSAIVFRPNGSAQLVGYGNIYLAGETDDMMAYFSTNILASTGRVNSYAHFYNW
jgi:type II secretion system protein H